MSKTLTVSEVNTTTKTITLEASPYVPPDTVYVVSNINIASPPKLQEHSLCTNETLIKFLCLEHGVPYSVEFAKKVLNRLTNPIWNGHTFSTIEESFQLVKKEYFYTKVDNALSTE